MFKKHMQKNMKPRDKAVLCLLDNDIDEAEEWLEKALEEDETDHAALGMMADVCVLRGEFQEAFGLMVLAIAQKPDEKAYLISFALCAGRLNFSFAHFNPAIAKAVEACLLHGEVNCEPLWRLWHALLLCHPEISALAAPDFSVDRKETAVIAAHPFLLAGLKRLVVSDWNFERSLTALRAALRKDISSPAPLWGREDLLHIAAALSRYCFYTEYIFGLTNEEEAWIEKMRKSLSDSSSAARAEDIAVFACYESLGSISGAANLAEVCDTESVLTPVADLQVREYLRLDEIKKSLPSITPIEDFVSGRVRAQYESFPYPRWHHLPHDAVLGEIEKKVPQNGRILNAGCGTGYEAALVGALFPEAEILAVDLSKSSLSYASARAHDLGLSHIRFAQADILQLECLTERYDYILSSGVLHHMQDPFSGWKVLRGLLKPGGIMRIGLYSEYARSSVVAAREAINAKDFSATPQGMRTFRQEADNLLPRDIVEKLRKSSDYYQMSTFCDLLFHVQEHRFDIERVARMLDELSLDFIGFNLPPVIFKAFQEMHGETANPEDLLQWHSFEKRNPETFGGMYQFWCRAKD